MKSTGISIRCFAIGLAICLHAGVFAQFYVRGEDPGHLKWQQIRSEHFRIIFPGEFVNEAQRFTHILEETYESNSRPLGHRPASIPVVIHNHSVLSNGFVAWAPKRMEIVPVPSANAASQDALEHLALHEFRHVVQVDKLNQGMTKWLTVPLGQIGTGVVAGLMPFWFLEGDAVDAETRLSLSGRGRLPSWEMRIKALLAEDQKLFTYEKALMGSYREFVPSHYEYGYQMVTHARDVYGNSIWDSLVTYTARNPYTLYPFYFGLKKYAGSSKSALYSETMLSLREHWKRQSGKRILTRSLPWNDTLKKHYTNYRFPEFLENGWVFAEKSGIDQIQEFVRIDSSGHEKRIHRPGFYDPASISVEKGVIVWTEIIRDVRWGRKSHSVIKLYRINSGKETMLTRESRYFAPDLSKDAIRIAAIEADVLNRYYLVIIDARSGAVLQKIPSPDNQYLQYPAWNHDHSGVYLTALGDEGKRILFIDLESGIWQEVFHAGFENIAELDAGKDFLVFRGTFSGIDNIYAINLETLDCKQVTSSRFGAFMPKLSGNGKRLLFSDYTSQGYNVHIMDFVPAEFIPFSGEMNHNEQKYRPERPEESPVQKVLKEPLTDYPVSPFRKYLDLFVPHSWVPLYTDIEDPDFKNPEIFPGFMLFSQNRLSTATTMLGYEYREKEHYFHASFNYTGLYPAFKLSYDFGGLPLIANPPEGVNLPERVKTNMNLNMEVYLPLNFTMSRYVTGLRPSVTSRFSRAYFYYPRAGGYERGLTFMDYRVYFYNYLKTSSRDILPRSGQIIELRHVSAPFESGNFGTQSFVSATLYLPGLLRHQTLRINASGQKQDAERYLMRNLADMPRGFEQQTALQLRKISADYIFPICYPDLNVWKTLYVKRIRGGLFIDHAFGRQVYLSDSNNGPENRHFTSLGGELTTDVHFAHLIFPVNMGGRFIYLPGRQDTMLELLFSVDLDQF